MTATRSGRAVHRVRHSLRARLVLLFLLFALALAGVFLFGTSRMLKGGWQAWAQPLVAYRDAGPPR